MPLQTKASHFFLSQFLLRFFFVHISAGFLRSLPFCNSQTDLAPAPDLPEKTLTMSLIRWVAKIETTRISGRIENPRKLENVICLKTII